MNADDICNFSMDFNGDDVPNITISFQQLLDISEQDFCMFGDLIIFRFNNNVHSIDIKKLYIDNIKYKTRKKLNNALYNNFREIYDELIYYMFKII